MGGSAAKWGQGAQPLVKEGQIRAHARLAAAEWGIGVPAQRPAGVWGEAPR